MQARDKLQYVLALVDELLNGTYPVNFLNILPFLTYSLHFRLIADESKAALFLEIKVQRFPFGPFLRLLSDSDWFTTTKAAKIVATLMM
jgi:hypothetical protein